MEAEDSDKDMFSDEDTQVTGNRQVWGTLNESFLLSLDLTDELMSIVMRMVISL